MNKKKVIFIDIDNTLLDFDTCIVDALKTGLPLFNIGEYKDEYFDIFNRENNKLWKRLEQGTLTLDELRRTRFDIIFKAFGVTGDGEAFDMWLRSFIYNYAKEVEGASAFINALKDKYILCAASNGPYEQQLHRLGLANVKDSFQYFFISQKMGVSKPKKLFFDKALEEIGGVTNQDCIMIGDSQSSDIQGGKDAGMMTIFFNKHHLQDLSNITADYSFDNLTDISQFLLDNDI